MVERILSKEIIAWAGSSPSRPLLLTGPPGVGKGNLARQVAKHFDRFLSFDLTNPGDIRHFGHGYPPQILLETLLFARNIRKPEGRVMIYIGEISLSPSAVKFFLDFDGSSTGIHLAAGTFLRDFGTGHPEKRFNAVNVFPLTFSEFLMACGETLALETYNEVPFPNYATTRLMDLFRQYTLTGGMPEAVGRYAEERNVTALGPVYEGLLELWTEVIGFPGHAEKVTERVRAILQDIFPFAATRIRMNGFANTGYSSRQIASVFTILENLMMVRFAYPVVSATLPVMPDHSRFPRLQIADTGMVSYFSGIREALSEADDLNAVFGRQVSRQVVGQELMAAMGTGDAPGFWVRDKTQSSGRG